MEIIPAIYVQNGKCVALYKSSPGQKETYSGTPLETARSFEKNGAGKLYLVDLDGKADNTFRQKALFKEIAHKVGIPVMFEAGFNSLDEIREALNLGAAQVVIRPAATRIVREAIREFGPEKVIVLIQAKGGGVVGVEKKSYEEAVDVVDYAESLVPMGVKAVVYKDERSEGTLIHPNYDEADRLVLVTGKDLAVYVAGGISEIRHLKLLKKIGVSGAVIGKAFYEKLLTVAEAEEAAED